MAATGAAGATFGANAPLGVDRNVTIHKVQPR
jgi:hypothetical protein